jgi:hypothetical protein
MESLSAVSESARVPLAVPLRACLRDHCFGGRAVLPAVEAMEMMARAVQGFHADAAVFSLGALRFDKFLDLPPAAPSLSAFCDLSRLENGDIEATLATRTTAGKSALARVKVHAAAVFHHEELAAAGPLPEPVPEEGWIAVPGARIYPELIPFGPFYRNVTDLRLGAAGAAAEIKTPVEDDAGPEAFRLGSPFALDAAFHAACVWGQRLHGIVAFPVAIDRRLIYRPTRPGEAYRVRAMPVREDSGVLVFDITITGAGGRLYESCSGVHMRDVSGGRLKPPGWIRTGARSP